MHDELWAVRLDDCGSALGAEDMRQVRADLQQPWTLKSQPLPLYIKQTVGYRNRVSASWTWQCRRDAVGNAGHTNLQRRVGCKEWCACVLSTAADCANLARLPLGLVTFTAK